MCNVVAVRVSEVKVESSDLILLVWCSRKPCCCEDDTHDGVRWYVTVAVLVVAAPVGA